MFRALRTIVCGLARRSLGLMRVRPLVAPPQSSHKAFSRTAAQESTRRFVSFRTQKLIHVAFQCVCINAFRRTTRRLPGALGGARVHFMRLAHGSTQKSSLPLPLPHRCDNVFGCHTKHGHHQRLRRFSLDSPPPGDKRSKGRTGGFTIMWETAVTGTTGLYIQKKC